MSQWEPGPLQINPLAHKVNISNSIDWMIASGTTEAPLFSIETITMMASESQDDMDAAHPLIDDIADTNSINILSESFAEFRGKASIHKKYYISFFWVRTNLFGNKSHCLILPFQADGGLLKIKIVRKHDRVTSSLFSTHVSVLTHSMIKLYEMVEEILLSKNFVLTLSKDFSKSCANGPCSFQLASQFHGAETDWFSYHPQRQSALNDWTGHTHFGSVKTLMKVNDDIIDTFFKYISKCVWLHMTSVKAFKELPLLYYYFGHTL